MLISEAPIGTKIMLGTINDEDIIWRKVSDNNDFIADNRIGYKCFDYREQGNLNRQRKNNGNNFFLHSNIFQWLNAVGSGWYVPKHEYDCAPGYYDEDGFLTGFTANEVGLIQEREINVLVPLGSRKEFGKSVSVQCKVCLPSASEAGLTDEEFAIEGENLPELTQLLHERKYVAMATRTGIRDGGHIVAFFRDGYIENVSAGRSHEIYPMIRLDGNGIISDDKDGFGVRHIPVPNDENYYQEFLKIISQ